MALGLISAAKGLFGGGEPPKQMSGSDMAQRMLPGSSNDEQEKEKIQSKKSALVRQPLIPASYTPPPKSQATEVEKSGVSPVDGALGSVRKSMAGLRDVAKKQFQFKKKDNADKRKRRENIFRKLGEKASELGGLGLRFIKRSKAFQRVKNYFQNILLGGILLWFAKNFKDVKAWFEETREKLEPIFENLKKWVFDPIFGMVKWIAVEGYKLTQQIMQYPLVQDSIEGIKTELGKLDEYMGPIKDATQKITDAVGGAVSGAAEAVGIDMPGGYSGGGRSGDLEKLISSAEGGLNSVNRGTAGDTPGGAKSILGKNLTEMTVDEVYAAQRSEKVFAVGKHQIIPITMPGFIKYLKSKGVDTKTAKFDERTQNMFMDYVVNVKRPEVGRYLRGETDDPTEAGQALAREYASIGLQYGEAGRGRGSSRYAGTGGNRASISPEEVIRALRAEREARLNPRPPSEVPSSTKRMSGGIVEHLHGDPGRSGYDYGGHGRESNAHDHFAFASKDLRLAVQRDLASGKGPSGRKWQIGSTTGGKHAPNSYHYVGQAFDVPWSQFGSGPIGQSDYEQSRQLKADVDALVRKYTQQKPAPKKPPSEVSSSVSATPSYQKVAVAAPVEQPPSTPIVIGGGGQQMVASGPSRRDLTNRSSQVRFNSRLWSA